MVLTPNPNKPMTIDSVGRTIYSLPTCGKSYVVNRGNAFFTSSIEPHFDDLLKILPHKLGAKSILVLIPDNGPDWNWSCLANILYASELFRQLDLDALMSASHCPGESAYNQIEHLWAPLTTAIAKVTFPAILPGEKVIPTKQTALSPAEQEAKLKGDDGQNSECMSYAVPG